VPSNASRSKPTWLQKRWHAQRADTVERVRKSIDALIVANKNVTLSAICEHSRQVLKAPLAVTTILRNEGARELYDQHARKGPKSVRRIRTKKIKEEIASELSEAQIHSRVSRLRRYTKDELVLKVLHQTQMLRRQMELIRRLRRSNLGLKLRERDNHCLQEGK